MGEEWKGDGILAPIRAAILNRGGARPNYHLYFVGDTFAYSSKKEEEEGEEWTELAYHSTLTLSTHEASTEILKSDESVNNWNRFGVFLKN